MTGQPLKAITTIAIILTVAAAMLSLTGIGITGFYPAIIVLCLLPLIPIGTVVYFRKASIARQQGGPRQTLLIILNITVIVVVLWMAFVIIHDRVLKDCC